jgi:hypothetical protein
LAQRYHNAAASGETILLVCRSLVLGENLHRDAIGAGTQDELALSVVHLHGELLAARRRAIH